VTQEKPHPNKIPQEERGNLKLQHFIFTILIGTENLKLLTMNKNQSKSAVPYMISSKDVFDETR
jgi:hypothetical protein